MAFELRNVPLLTRVGADRADQLRSDVDAALAGWPGAAVLRVDSRSQVLISRGQAVLSDARGFGAKPPQDAVFLGPAAGRTACVGNSCRPGGTRR